MKRIKSVVKIFAMLISFMSFGFMASAAGTQCVTLKPSKTYSYNLDGKGAKEKIKYTITQGEADSNYCYTYDINVTVNGKSFYKKALKAWETPVRILLTDVDTRDKQKEILILEGESLNEYWTSDIKKISYYRYKSGKMSYVQDLADLFKKGFEKKLNTIHGVSNKGNFLKMDGKGKLSANVCLQFSFSDYKHFQRTVVLKNGKFSVSKLSSVNIQKEANNYTMVKSVKMYTTAGGKKVAATIKKKKTAIVTGIYRNSKGTLYFIVKYGGKKGYVSPSTFLKNAAQHGCLHV